MYQSVKQHIIGPYLKLKNDAIAYNIAMNYRTEIKGLIKMNQSPKLDRALRNSALKFYKSKGITLQNTLWHRYFTARTGVFYDNYLPEDIFHPYIARKCNEDKQWPALLDKNLSYDLFREFDQPTAFIRNINGFYYKGDQLVHKEEAIEFMSSMDNYLIIKPSIESGGGQMIKTFHIRDGITDIDGISIRELMDYYRKDFIIQEFVTQSPIWNGLNETSLNTVRVLSYLRENEVHILSVIVRIGSKGATTDNYSKGGLVCGVEDDGRLKSVGYGMTGENTTTAPSGIRLEGIQIPNYHLVKAMIKALHLKIPYFRIASWDIGINEHDLPVYIECNTYRQGIRIHQIPNGPFLGRFEDEILAMATK